MANENISTHQVTIALQLSARHLERHKKVLDNLNVFPVPDGDTGTNMAGTFVPAVELLQGNKIQFYHEIAEIMLPYMTSNSRGNSGFILSSFFKGFFANLQENQYLTTHQLAQGFSNGCYQVNSSLFNPIAGTMVTIIESMTRCLNDKIHETPAQALQQALSQARLVLFQTPEMLPILARAGVIDSGALGFIMIFEGLYIGLSPEEELPEESEEPYRFTPDKKTTPPPQEDTTQYQYCTELTLTKHGDVDTSGLHDFLTSRGDSIALMDESKIIKLHIHCNEPEQILKEMESYGTITRKKVEDMFAQILQSSKSLEESNNAVLVFAPGEGFRDYLIGLGVVHVICYDNKLPSGGEVARVLEEMEEKSIIILPNNSNILPSCITAGELSEKQISIIPTSNIIQGITSFYGFSENEDLQTNLQSMKECMSLGQGLFLYESADNRSFGGIEIKKNHFFCLHNSDIISVHGDFTTALLKGIKSFDLEVIANLSLFYKQKKQLVSLEEIQKTLLQEFPHLEIELLWGGQSQAEIIVALE